MESQGCLPHMYFYSSIFPLIHNIAQRKHNIPCLLMQALECVWPAEMELLDINLTKVSSLLLNAIHSPFYWQNLKKTILFSGLKILTKTYAKKENSSLFMNIIL